MKKTILRLLIFFIGIPLVIALVLWPLYNHLPLHIVFVLASMLAANELYNMFKTQGELISKPLVITLSAIPSLVAAAYQVLPAFFPQLHFPFGLEIITYAYIITILIILVSEVLGQTDFTHSNRRISASAFIVFYAGYLITFISRMTSATKASLPCSSQIIAIFFLMVFLCDSLAWFFGVLLGKNNKGLIKASPNKSVAGFIGGSIGSILAGLIGYYIWPEIFSGSVVKIIIVSLCIALAGIIGDLAESVFKRSSGVKDSGKIIPGRGGLLDSVDSILMAAPVYYGLVSLLYGIGIS